MRGLWAIAGFVSLSACNAGPPSDCNVAIRHLNECVDRFGPDRQREAVLACLPFSKPEKIEGAWYWGFELNAFVEGARASPRNLTPPVNSDTSLEFYDPHLPVDGRVRVLQVQLIGRRSQCRLFPDNWIVVDRMLSRTIRGVSN